MCFFLVCNTMNIEHNKISVFNKIETCQYSYGSLIEKTIPSCVNM